MPVKRKTINLSVDQNGLFATDAETGLATSDAGMQGEDGAVWLHVDIPADWSGLSARLQVLSTSGSCDESGLPNAGAIDMPLRAGVTAPGRMTVTLKGFSGDGVRRTAQCSLTVTAVDCPPDSVAQVYPLAFENLCNQVEKGVVHSITGSGGARVTKTGDTSYEISVTGTGGDMLGANYASGAGGSNPNTVDHAVFADKTGDVENAAHADTAQTAEKANEAAAGSPLEDAIHSKQATLTAGANGGIDLLSGSTVKSIKTRGLTVSSDSTSVTLGLDGAPVTTGMIVYSAAPIISPDWKYCDGRELKIADYRNLYDKIGIGYGQGTTSYVLITPTYLTDNADPADDIVLQKYTNSIQPVSYFSANGTVFTGDDFQVTTPGDYTVYCKDSQGREAVQYAHVDGMGAPFVIFNSCDAITKDLKLLTHVNINDVLSTINLVKIAQGVQTAPYFSTLGTQLGTKDDVTCTFQAGTSYPGGTYTFYAKDAAGNEAIQYFNAVPYKTLNVTLDIDFGSDTFKLPNLMGTLNNLCSPYIRV